MPALLFLLLAFRAFADGENAKGQPNDFISVVTANFYAWDTDRDGTLSKQELAAAIKDPGNKGAMAAALAALKRGRVPDVLTTASLRHLPDKDKARLLSLYNQFLKRCQEMLNKYEKTGQPSIAEQVAKSCLLLPNAVSPEDLTRAANLAARAVTISKDGDWMHWRLMTRGLAELRAGKYQTAIETEQQSRQQKTLRHDLNGPACEADACFISAMAHYRLGQSAEFQTDLNNALKIVQEKLPKLDSGDLGLRCFDTLMANILMREAEAMRQ